MLACVYFALFVFNGVGTAWYGQITKSPVCCICTLCHCCLRGGVSPQSSPLSTGGVGADAGYYAACRWMQISVYLMRRKRILQSSYCMPHPLTEQSCGCWWWSEFRLARWSRPARRGALHSLRTRCLKRRDQSPCRHREGPVCRSSSGRRRRGTWIQSDEAPATTTKKERVEWLHQRKSEGWEKAEWGWEPQPMHTQPASRVWPLLWAPPQQCHYTTRELASRTTSTEDFFCDIYGVLCMCVKERV